MKQKAAVGKPKIFYGWVLVGLAVSVFAVMDGAVYYIFGVYLGPMADDMGWSRGSTSAAFSLFVAVMGLSGPLIALRIDRFGVRWFLLLGGVLIVAAFLLAISRAIGETMAVTICCGNSPNMTLNPLESIQTMTSFIVNMSLGDAATGSTVYKSLYAVALTLFCITLAMNVVSQAVMRRYREVYT